MGSPKQPSVRAAFEISKGSRDVMTLSEADVERYLDPRELLDGLEDGFRSLEQGVGTVAAPDGADGAG